MIFYTYICTEMSRKRIDLIGQKFGRLTVMEFSHIYKGQACWVCKCDCGDYTKVSSGSLKSSRTKSCGCLKKELCRKRSLPKGVAARNYVIRQHKANARQKNLEQALTDEQIIILHRKSCHYCGALPSNSYSLPSGFYIYSGIDRIDNDKGYTITNTVPCCRACNYFKRTYSYDEFLALIKRIHSHLNL